jgi:hypothetical protein
MSEKKLEFSDVQYAVETLILADLADGSHESGVDGINYTNLKVTKKGRAAAIRTKRQQAEGADALAAASERAEMLDPPL